LHGQRQSMVLVDDVMTTGATLRAAAEAWQRSGGRVLGAVVLAYVPAPGTTSQGSAGGSGHDTVREHSKETRWHAAFWERTEGIR